MTGGGVPGAGGCKGLILLRPLNSPVRHLPQQATCGWFWVPFAIKRYMNQQSAGCVFWRFLGRQKAPQKPTGTMKKPERRGLTLAPGDYSRVCKQTVPGARIFNPHLSFRFFHQAGDSPARRPSIKKEGSALRLQRTKNRTKAEPPGAEGWKGLIFLHPPA